MEKKIATIIILLAFIVKVAAQVEVHSSNQVGIGTNNPQYKLHVVGDAFVTGNLLIGTSSTFLGTTGNYPLIFKTNNVLAGSTGSAGNTNVSFGHGALIDPQAAVGNTAVGYEALHSTQGGNRYFGWNTAVGSYALYSNTTGHHNTAIGSYALYSNTTSHYVTAIGSYALYSNTTGINNNAVGYHALRANTSGSYNNAFGYEALRYNTTGHQNTAIGLWSLYSNTMGNGNTAIGYSSLHRNTTGSYNTALGFNSTNYNNLDNTTSIGFGASVTSSNQVRIGNNAINSIGGHVAWSTFSDGRVKKNIRTDVPGLAFINSLQPVTYNMDLDAIDELMKFEEPEIRDDDMEAPPPKSQEMIEIERKAREAKEKIVQTGFVAQDVEKAAKEAGYDFSGVDVDEIGIYSLRYAEFVVPLVKAVQELSEQNDRLQEQINELNRRLEILENK